MLFVVLIFDFNKPVFLAEHTKEKIITVFLTLVSLLLLFLPRRNTKQQPRKDTCSAQPSKKRYQYPFFFCFYLVKTTTKKGYWLRKKYAKLFFFPSHRIRARIFCFCTTFEAFFVKQIRNTLFFNL